MKLFVQIGDREYPLEIIEEAGERKVLLDGEPFDIQYREADSLGQVIVMHGGRSYGLSVEGDLHKAHVTLAGYSYSLTMEDERERAANLAAKEALGGGGPLEATMPGIVVEVLVQEGQEVAAGQPLLILEAMKMQNEIVAPGDGVVDRIAVQAGETVPAGHVLVVLRGPDGA